MSTNVFLFKGVSLCVFMGHAGIGVAAPTPIRHRAMQSLPFLSIPCPAPSGPRASGYALRANMFLKPPVRSVVLVLNALKFEPN